MGRAGVRTDAFFSVEGREAVFAGVSGCGGATAVGRIYIFDRREASEAAGALIVCLFDMPCESELDGLMAELSPVGMILSASAISPRLLEHLIESGIPYLILKDRFSSEYAGRVAMLDTERDVIVINPGLDAIGHYSRKSQRDELAAPCNLPPHRPEILMDADGKGIMADINALVRRKELYPALMEIAESFCGVPVAAAVTVPGRGETREGFCDMIESIYRAAVYGSFSILLKGYGGEADIKMALGDMHRVFCRLEEEGREFNGYLRKGIFIDSPVWLFRVSPFLKADTVCFDLDSITAHLLGCGRGELAGRELEEEAMFRIWEQYFSRFATECCRRICCREIKNERFLERLTALSDADEVYRSSL